MKSKFAILTALGLLSSRVAGEDFNWDADGGTTIIPAPKDQGECAGAGWAFAATTTIEANYKLKYNRWIS